MQGKEAPSIKLAHDLYKTNRLNLKARIKNAFAKGKIDLFLTQKLLQACEVENESDQLENVAQVLLPTPPSVVDASFLVAEWFDRIGLGWNHYVWLEQPES